MMNETDDRLAGDAVWELFGQPAPLSAREASRARLLGRRLIVAGLIGLVGLLSPTLAVIAVCLTIAAGDFRTGRRLARSIPAKAGGAICARFRYAWGAWKLGAAAFALMFACVAILGPRREKPGVPPAFFASLLLCMGGFVLSAALTASGVWIAYRSGMRVWIGEGVNRARTLLMGMLIVAFTVVVLGPLIAWASGRIPRASDSGRGALPELLFFCGFLFGSPVVIVLVLDWIGRRVIADGPGKFGPKVPAVGKWNA
jgi:hypothetical protein